jgi:hypothetical protein
MSFTTFTGILKIATAAACLVFCAQSIAQTDVKTSTVAMNVAPQLSVSNKLSRKINYCPAGCNSSLDCRQCAGYSVCHFPAGSNSGICSDR